MEKMPTEREILDQLAGCLNFALRRHGYLRCGGFHGKTSSRKGGDTIFQYIGGSPIHIHFDERDDPYNHALKTFSDTVEPMGIGDPGAKQNGPATLRQLHFERISPARLLEIVQQGECWKDYTAALAAERKLGS